MGIKLAIIVAAAIFFLWLRSWATEDCTWPEYDPDWRVGW